MQMTGTQRIAVPNETVWDALFDPEILKQCIPGCQSLIRESAERMRAAAEIKIGPIGARFNGTVLLSDIDATRGYTLSIEGQGGTVGFVKSRIKVRLAEEDGATLLSYDIDAEVGGRLAQLGGPLIDATAKQLAGKFFVRFGALVGAPDDARTTQAGAHAPAATAVIPGTAPPSHTFVRPASIAWMVALLLAALIGYTAGHVQRGAESEWMGLAVGLLLVIVAAAGFEAGRRSAAPVVILDPALLSRLSQEAKR